MAECKQDQLLDWPSISSMVPQSDHLGQIAAEYQKDSEVTAGDKQ